MMIRSPASQREEQKLNWDVRYVGTRISRDRLVTREPSVLAKKEN